MLWDDVNSEAWEQLAAKGTHRLVFDIDDVMWDPDYKPFANHYTPDVLARVWRNIGLAHVVTTPSEIIAEYVSRFNPNVHYVPNTVPEYLLKLRRPARVDYRYVVGYQGSPSHSTDFSKPIMEQLTSFLEKQEDWRMHFWGPNEVSGWPEGKVDCTPWASSLKKYYLSLNMDVGIGPLARTPFNAGKSALRAIEYAALGIVAVLSDEPPYRGWVEPGVTGILLKPRKSWYRALNEIAADPVWRVKMGQEARRRAAAWTTEACIMTWVQAWNSA